MERKPFHYIISEIEKSLGANFDKFRFRRPFGSKSIFELCSNFDMTELRPWRSINLYTGELQEGVDYEIEEMAHGDEIIFSINDRRNLAVLISGEESIAVQISTSEELRLNFSITDSENESEFLYSLRWNSKLARNAAYLSYLQDWGRFAGHPIFGNDMQDVSSR